MQAKTDALYTIGSRPLAGVFYRYLRTKHGDKPLSMDGALANGGRYNVANLFGALYLGFDRKTCEAEVSQGYSCGRAALRKSRKLIFQTLISAPIR
jgi:RES domain-containing protein